MLKQLLCEKKVISEQVRHEEAVQGQSLFRTSRTALLILRNSFET